MKNKNIACSYK